MRLIRYYWNLTLNWQSLKLGRNDRGALIGQTGCGKTTLAEYLVRDENKKNSVAFDPKGSESVARWEGHSRYSNFGEIVEAAEVRGEGRLIYTPSPLVAEDADTQDELFAWIYARGYTRLYIDEATALTGGTYPSRYLIALLNRGRERGISTLVATQRPARIPMNIISEAQHFYIFKLLLLADRKRVEELTGISVEVQTELRDYQFYYFSASKGAHAQKLKLNLGGI